MHDTPHVASQGIDLVQVVVLLAAGVVAIPLFKRIGLGPVLGCLVAGMVIGPAGLAMVSDPQAVLHAAELGVVMFLFVIGLEMEPTKLWALRNQIFGLGVAQVMTCAALLTGVGVVLGYSPMVAFVFGVGFVLTSTAIVMQVLGENNELGTPGGEKMVSILLLEDLAIVPLLAFVALAAPEHTAASDAERWLGIGLALGSVLLVVAVGRWFLNPLFRLFAAAKAREVMTAAALLVVLGAALVMQVGGLSMAMGAFLAGVLLSSSTFRHQLEADIEPFRGILLGLFFLAVGMNFDLRIFLAHWDVIAISVVAFMVVKSVAIYGIARLFKSDHDEALERGVLMAQGGEFAFVLYTTAASVNVIDAASNALFTATVILSMVLTPLTMVVWRRLTPARAQSMDGVETANGLSGRVLVIGFGRFGQIACQGLLARRYQVSIIDNDVDMIRAAATYGFKVYYGDGRRLDILHAAGIERTEAVLVCIDDREAISKIVELLRHEFPLLKVLVRAFDRSHMLELSRLGVSYQIRELFESSLAFGQQALLALGESAEDAERAIAEVRERDRQRLELQLLGDLHAGKDLLFQNAAEAAKEQGVLAPTPVPTAANEPT